ncbi:TrkA-N domain protein [Desulfovibrio sp. X2]|uniref:potassium channel family protein n=1 Tax=Desulfovibrio sp. X2 TaxID=941449 RepID=UPI000358CD6B|nr:TrkA family potassium uptake protein [Desulfovibrio sp. X2]EPR42342.1 TrkA-N domain protein [Desulfovibrio sp. X2]
MRKTSVGVIGLGKFGLSFAQTLVDLGQEVVGLDAVPDNVRRAQDVLTQVYQGDAMDKKVLEQLGFSDLGVVMVSVGQSIEASAMICLYLKEMGAAQVWVKAVSRDHEKLLNRIGVDHVILPEYFAASQLAHSLATPGLIAYLPFDEGMALREVNIERWSGKTLRDLNLTNTYGVQVIAIRNVGDARFVYVPRADIPLKKGDTLVVLGRTEDLERLKP